MSFYSAVTFTLTAYHCYVLFGGTTGWGGPCHASDAPCLSPLLLFLSPLLLCLSPLLLCPSRLLLCSGFLPESVYLGEDCELVHNHKMLNWYTPIPLISPPPPSLPLSARQPYTTLRCNPKHSPPTQAYIRVLYKQVY
jgi:hypothetical protein